MNLTKEILQEIGEEELRVQKENIRVKSRVFNFSFKNRDDFARLGAGVDVINTGGKTETQYIEKRAAFGGTDSEFNALVDFAKKKLSGKYKTIEYDKSRKVLLCRYEETRKKDGELAGNIQTRGISDKEIIEDLERANPTGFNNVFTPEEFEQLLPDYQKRNNVPLLYVLNTNIEGDFESKECKLSALRAYRFIANKAFTNLKGKKGEELKKYVSEHLDECFLWTMDKETFFLTFTSDREQKIKYITYCVKNIDVLFNEIEKINGDMSDEKLSFADKLLSFEFVNELDPFLERSNMILKVLYIGGRTGYVINGLSLNQFYLAGFEENYKDLPKYDERLLAFKKTYLDIAMNWEECKKQIIETRAGSSASESETETKLEVVVITDEKNIMDFKEMYLDSLPKTRVPVEIEVNADEKGEKSFIIKSLNYEFSYQNTFFSLVDYCFIRRAKDLKIALYYQGKKVYDLVSSNNYSKSYNLANIKRDNVLFDSVVFKGRNITFRAGCEIALQMIVNQVSII